MKKYNFQDWLSRNVSNDPEAILAGKLEHLRIYLTDAMRDLRDKAGLTQAQLAEKLGVQQAAVSKLESAQKDHQIEPVLHYLHALGADLLVAVKQGEKLYQVSDNEGVVLVDIPAEVQKLARVEGMTLPQYVCTTIRRFSLTVFLESDDSVAVRVREKLAKREAILSQKETLSEIAVQLEKCLSLPKKEDRIFAVRRVLACNTNGAGINPEGNNNYDTTIELFNLAEELLEKFAEIWN